jgi:hypothetical protein
MVELPQLNGNLAEYRQSYLKDVHPVNTSIENGQAQSELLYFPHQLDNPSVRERLLNRQASENLVNRVFDENGRWILRGVDDIPDFWSKDSRLISMALIDVTKPVYDLVDWNLLGEKWPHGFNRHNLENHILVVRDTSDALLDKAGYEKDARIKRINEVASIGHDLGNIIDRKTHASLSPIILETVTPSVTQSQKEWEKAKQAIDLHDEKVLHALMESWGNATREEDVAHLRALANPVLLALVLSDKADIGRHRTNPWARNTETVNSDEHMWVNYLAKGGGFEMSRDGRGLSMVVNFNPTLSNDEFGDFVTVAEKRSRHDGYRAAVPDVIKDIHYQHNIPHFHSWNGKMMAIYLERFKLSALCAKALFPKLDTFALELRDGRNQRSRGGGRYIEEIDFRGDLNEQFLELDTVYAKRDLQKSEYTQAEIIFEPPQS